MRTVVSSLAVQSSFISTSIRVPSLVLVFAWLCLSSYLLLVSALKITTHRNTQILCSMLINKLGYSVSIGNRKRERERNIRSFCISCLWFDPAISLFVSDVGYVAWEHPEIDRWIPSAHQPLQLLGSFDEINYLPFQLGHVIKRSANDRWKRQSEWMNNFISFRLASVHRMETVVQFLDFFNTSFCQEEWCWRWQW